MPVLLAIFVPMEKVCKCGESFKTTQKRLEAGRGMYCSKSCMYRYRVRPKGLNYTIVKDNPTSFKKGQEPWNKGLRNLPPPVNFKGDEVGYHALHDWVRRHKGKPEKCDNCGGNKRMQWANKSHEYKRDLTDWLSLCQKCHIKYDRESGKWGVATRKFNLNR